MREDLGKIVLVSERAAGLCRQMLAYSGRGRFVLGPLDLNQTVKEMLGLLQVSISKKATLHVNLAERLPPIIADATQVRQVVMNLVLNASEAIGDRAGAIRVATGVRLADAGPFVFLQVADTGCGMDEETRRRIFEPFFTTKFTGRGLGLAAVQGIVRGHKGVIEVESEPGRGSTFRLLLPAAKEESEQRRQPPPASVPWQGEGTILVADDEAWVRDVAARMLQSLGFKVIVARDGEEALVRWQEAPDEVRLVLLDLTMPKLDGEETFRTLHLLRPELPVILMSGFSEHEAAGRFAGKGLTGFLAKPFGLENLAETMRSAFESSRGQATASRPGSDAASLKQTNRGCRLCHFAITPISVRRWSGPTRWTRPFRVTTSSMETSFPLDATGSVSGNSSAISGFAFFLPLRRTSPLAVEMWSRPISMPNRSFTNPWIWTRSAFLPSSAMARRTASFLVSFSAMYSSLCTLRATLLL